MTRQITVVKVYKNILPTIERENNTYKWISWKIFLMRYQIWTDLEEAEC